jgi:hypothetical protein
LCLPIEVVVVVVVVMVLRSKCYYHAVMLASNFRRMENYILMTMVLLLLPESSSLMMLNERDYSTNLMSSVMDSKIDSTSVIFHVHHPIMNLWMMMMLMRKHLQPFDRTKSTALMIMLRQHPVDVCIVIYPFYLLLLLFNFLSLGCQIFSFLALYL